MPFKNYERIQEQINNYQMPDSLSCIKLTFEKPGEYRLVARTHSNWDIYADSNNYLYSVAKPCSGAGTSHFGPVSHLKRLIKIGIGRYDLTPFGEQLLYDDILRMTG